MQTSLVRWRAPPFFTFCWTSVKNIIAFTARIVRIVIPNSLNGVVWAVRTAVKLAVLFVGLIILLVGPRIGLPRTILQVANDEAPDIYTPSRAEFQFRSESGLDTFAATDSQLGTF